MVVKRNIQAQTFTAISQKSDSIVLPILLDVYHPSIIWAEDDIEQDNGHLRLVNDVIALRYKGDEKEPKVYMPCKFEYKPPKEDGKKKNTASISISCIDQRMIEVIRSVPEGLKCNVVALYSKITDDDGKVKYIFQKMGTYDFSMYSCQWNGVTATWSLDPDETMEYSVPRDVGSPFRIPSVIEG